MQTLNMATLKIFLLVSYLMVVVLPKSCSNKHFYEDCKEGDVILTGLFSIHDKTANDKCDTTLNVQALATAEAMVHAIDQVNNDPYLLPNITLGYRIFDTCGIPSRANDIAFSFVIENAVKERMQLFNATQDERFHNSTRRNQISSRPIAAVIGPGDSASSVVVASMFQVGNLPQISPSATSDELSQSFYSSFFRTVPPDSQQAKTISDIIEYFNWTYIAVIGSESSYGRYGVRALEHEAHELNTYCIHTVEFFPPSNYENKIRRIIAKLKKATNVKVIVLWAGGISSIHYVFQEAYKQQLFDRIWIAPDGWSETTSLFTTKYSAVIGGFIGTTFRHFNVSSFERKLLSMNSSSPRSQDNPWWREFWKTVNNCSQLAWKGCREKRTKMNPDLLSVMRSTTLAYVIDAVQAAAHAIDAIYRCQHSHNNLSQVTCLSSKHGIHSTDVLGALRKIQFQGLTGRISFNENGDSLRSAAYDIVNLQFVPGGTPVLKKVGTWDRALTERLQLNSDVLVWKNGSQVVPTSRCSEFCPPGTKQTLPMSCCWECIPCPPGTVSTTYSATNCTACAEDEKSNYDSTKCEALPVDSLTLNDGRGIALMATAVIGIILILFTFGVFVKYRHTPVVKSSNQQLSYVYLFSILVAFAVTSLLTVSLTPFSCAANLFINTIYYNVCVSILFLKTVRLLHAFKFQVVSSSTSHWLYNTRNQFALLGILNLLPVVFKVIVLLVVSPSLIQVTIVPQQYKIPQCKMDASTTGLVISCAIYAYEFILSVLVAYYAFRARKLPSNFNETKYIAFIMYIQLTTTATTIAIFTSSLAGSIRTTLYCLLQLCSAYSFLLCIFAPKLFIILRHQEKNTAEFVKANVARKTLERCLGNSFYGLHLVVPSAERSQKRSRSETSSTMLSSLSTNSVPSVAERAPRRVTWDSHMTTDDIITGRGFLDKLQLPNGIRSLTGHEKGNSNGGISVAQKQDHDNAFSDAAISEENLNYLADTGHDKPEAVEAQETRF